MSRGAACGPPFGMGWDVESSGAGDGFPPGLWFLLGLGVVTGLSGVNIVHVCACRQGVVVTRLGESSTPSPLRREGHPTHSVLETLRLRSGRTEFPTPGDGLRLGGGSAFRRDGFLPPQE